MKTVLYRLISIIAVIVFLIAGLRFLGWLPKVIQKDTMREYTSLEEAETALHIKSLLKPTYFPHDLMWPPSSVIAQARPFNAVVMEFNFVNSGEAGLIITQTASSSFAYKGGITMKDVTKRAEYILKKRKSILEVGTCGSAVQCSRLSWQEGDQLVTVIMRADPFALIKLCESMLE